MGFFKSIFFSTQDHYTLLYVNANIPNPQHFYSSINGQFKPNIYHKLRSTPECFHTPPFIYWLYPRLLRKNRHENKTSGSNTHIKSIDLYFTSRHVSTGKYSISDGFNPRYITHIFEISQICPIYTGSLSDKLSVRITRENCAYENKQDVRIFFLKHIV